ncbi:MAG: hypothetical protein IKR92_00575 [Alphaproteobacteria bacterium]|nr:hypothetical protein [Alphaproteobacteria bacterium]
MAVRFRYVEVDELPETGVMLASAPYLQKYDEVLDSAVENLEKQSLAYYNTAEQDAREISYMYALNSIYRSLSKWQKDYPNENIDIQQLRQDIVDIVPYFMEKEFPGIEYKIEDNLVKYKTEDKVTKKIIDPQAFEIDAEQKARLNDILRRVDGFVVQRGPFHIVDEDDEEENKSANEEENTGELSNDVADVQTKKQYIVRNKGKRNKRQDTRQMSLQEQSGHRMFALLCKMCYFLKRKSDNQQVYDFKTSSERANTLKNDLLQKVENLTKQENVQDKRIFSRNQQVLADQLDQHGMEIVWYKELPYETDFVNHLENMKTELQESDIPPEFFNTKLPLLLKLSEDLQNLDPEETKTLAEIHQKFKNSDELSKEDVLALVTETQRIALEKCEIDQIKSTAMRAAWDGLIRNPDKRFLSPVIQDLLKVRDNICQQGLKPEMQQKVDAYLKTDYTNIQYDLNKNKVWNIVKQVPQFKSLETELIKQARAMGVSPQDFETLKYDDIAFLLNRARIENTSQMYNKDGVKIVSDKSLYYKNLLQNNEKALRKTIQDYYYKKYMMEMVMNGEAHRKTQSRIQRKAKAAALKQTNDVIENMRLISEDIRLADDDMSLKNKDFDFNVHHYPPISKIAQFERMTGQPFYKINQSVLLVNRDLHNFFHINENAIDKSGRLRTGDNIANQTKYVLRDRQIKDGDDVVGYYGSAVSCMIVPKRGMVAMVDFKSFVFASLSLRIYQRLQKDLIELNKKYKVHGKRLIIPYVNLGKTFLFLRKALNAVKLKAKEVVLNISNTHKPIENVETNNNAEMAKARELDAMNQQRRVEKCEEYSNNQIKNQKPRGNINFKQRFTLSDKKKKFYA